MNTEELAKEFLESKLTAADFVDDNGESIKFLACFPLDFKVKGSK